MVVVMGRAGVGDGDSLASSSVWFPWPHHPVPHCAPGSAVWAASTAFSKPFFPCPVQSPPFESWVMVWWMEVWGLLWTDVGSYE